MEGWLRKKSPKTQGKKVMDLWQKRYFTLSGGELKYFKSEKAAHASHADCLKKIRLAEVLNATANPRHADMFVIDLGHDKKVKLQAGSRDERDTWVAALEAAKLKAWSRQEDAAYSQALEESRISPPKAPGAAASGSQSPGSQSPGAPASCQSPAKAASPFGTQPPLSPRNSGSERQSGASPVSHHHVQAELLRARPGHKQGCCIVS